LPVLDQEFDFADATVGPQERLAGLLALDCGLGIALGQVIERVTSYSSFIEEELDSQSSPAALQYLQRIDAVLNRALAWMTQHTHSFAASAAFEPLDMTRIVDAAARRWPKLIAAEQQLQLNLAQEEILVNGCLYQLQELLVNLPLVYSACTGRTPATIVVHSEPRMVEQAVFELVRSRCPAGRYLAITVANQQWQQSAHSGEQPQSFCDLLLARADVAAAAELRLLQLYGVVSGHGGEIMRYSYQGVDAMVLLLPLIDKRKQMQAPAELDDKELYGSETILLVDDEDMIWDVVIDMFQSLGYTVVLAANGRDAVDIYAENPGLIDLVLLDMVMPEMNGRDAFFALQQLDPQVRVLLSSGYVSEDDARDVLEAGAHGFLRKPYRMVDLAKAIRQIFAATTA